MNQKIDGFAETFSTKDGATASLAYYEQKKILAQSFGSAKAQRHLQSVLTNRVEETAEGKRGVNDQRVKKMAQAVKENADQIKKLNSVNETKRRKLFSQEALMPAQIFDLVPYKETH